MKSIDVCRELDIRDNTLRKYCLALEKVDYTFQRTEQGHRIFTNDNVMTLKRVMKQVRESGMSVETAINEVLEIKSQPTTSQLITYYNQREQRMRAMHEIELRAKDREIAALNEIISTYQACKEVAVSVEKPSFLQRIMQVFVPS